NGGDVRTPSVSVLLYILAGVLVVVTFCGNLVVIISISHFSQLHTPTNLLVLSLAAADFLVGVLIMPIIIIQSIETCWYFGEVFCFIYTFFLALLTTASIINLAVIAIDRYIAICHPLTYSNKITVQIVVWLFAFTYSCSMSLFGGSTEGIIGLDPCPGDCIITLTPSWNIADLIFSFLLPFSIIIVLYAHVFQGKNISKKSERKAAKTLGIVISIFLSCWLPYYCYTVINQFFSLPPYLYNILTWIAYLNSGINPVIYAFFYPWFRKSRQIHVQTWFIFD
uniref:G-protein coupled receptors family 1 profile domain-containing protein n=1 Tax=Erpetoichthys calabaricus TaxID=27687 RepID=A0A8C4RJW2_ERPCA